MVPDRPGGDDSSPENAFFGRRKGHRLRDGQSRIAGEKLPMLRLPEGRVGDLAALFDAPVDDFWLEIGFGGGEHLLHRMAENPGVGFVGVEPFVNGMAKLLTRVGPEETGRLRVYDADAAPLLARLPDASLGRVYLLYPDPWPKQRHNKRRFVSDATLASLARVVRPGGLFLFASDIDHYVGWTLARILRSADWLWPAGSADDWRRPFPGWPGTRYEAKALREGRVPSYLTFVRR